MNEKEVAFFANHPGGFDADLFAARGGEEDPRVDPSWHRLERLDDDVKRNLLRSGSTARLSARAEALNRGSTPAETSCRCESRPAETRRPGA